MSIDRRLKELEEENRTLRVDLEQRNRHLDNLRESEERFRLLVDGVKDYAIFVLDPSGNVASWNTGAQKIKGYYASEIIGSHFSRFYTSEDRARHWPEHELTVARAEGRFEDEGWRVRKDGTCFWANVIITPLFDGEHSLRGFAKVTRDLTTRRRMEAIQEYARQMDQFLAMLGHELRNPLAAIVNALALVRRDASPVSSDPLRVVDRQVGHLARIVDDLLDVSRITRGKVTLKREILHLKEVVSLVLESCRPMIAARRHSVDLQTADSEVWVEADRTRLSQIVFNLIGNAVKYTPVGGHITIDLRREANEAVMRVRDTGIGISTVLLPNVFDLFVQGDKSLDCDEGGLGIGLTLVKTLVEMHGGSIAAYSGGQGEGSEFIVRLPAVHDRVAIRETSMAAAKFGSPVRRRILIADDNRDLADTLASVLELMGHEVRTAYTGQDAISIATEFRPAAVFLDIGLPGMSGYDVARTFRRLPELARTTLIAFTGYGQEDDRRRAKDAGFDHHVVKPAEADTLAKLIETLPERD
ncbi:MAG: ATP-binding protein [Betaproteobacteria bacterium]